LRVYDSPISQSGCPFFLNPLKGQKNNLGYRLLIRKNSFILSDLLDTPVHAFDWIGEKRGQAGKQNAECYIIKA
jgi:hypothetical protein